MSCNSDLSGHMGYLKNTCFHADFSNVNRTDIHVVREKCQNMLHVEKGQNQHFPFARVSFRSSPINKMETHCSTPYLLGIVYSCRWAIQ